MRNKHLAAIAPALSATVLSAAAVLTASSAIAAPETRALVLDNGIEVYLTSDPDLDRSAAGLSVEVGSMNNDGVSGIAHFLEHMLFLGTEKYPDPADYKDYLAQNDGLSNAYTADNHTNYFFEVRTDAFEGALDRFSRFFIDPLMSDTLSAREVNAVDSEHSKNLQDDYWRSRQVYRSLLNPEHPHRGFSTGNSKTLANVRNDALRAFYEATYSSNLMHLVVISSHPLDTLEAWARTKFADIPNRKHTSLASQINVPLHDDSLRGHMIEIKSVQDVHQLWVRFELPREAFDDAAKPSAILGGVLGHEGKESLLQSLKSDGLATSLSAGAQAIGEQGIFTLTIGMTPAGLAAVDTVLERTFGMINHLRALPELPTHVLSERQAMAEIQLRFRQADRPFNEVRTLGASMIRYPHDDLMNAMMLIPAPSQQAVRTVLDVMTPENAVILVYAQDRETDQVEEHYQTGYRVQPLGEERIARLRAAKPAAGMGVSAPNPFVPTDFDLVETTHAETPWIHKFEFGEAWLKHDTLFGQPKAAIEVALINDKNSKSARDFVLGNLYANAVQLAINPHSYPLLEAGVNLRVSSERNGITLTADGFSQKIPELAAFATPFLAELRIDAAQFGVLKEQYARGLANFPKGPPTGQAFEMFREVIREVHFTPAQQAAALAEVQFADLGAYFERVHDALHIRAFFYGNMTEDGVKQTVDTLVAGLQPTRAIPEAERYEGRVIKLKKDSDTVLRRPIESNDSVSLLMLQGEPANREQRAALAVLGKVFSPSFYGDLRTLQQTGYIVQAGAFESESIPTLYMFSQSSVVGTDSLRGRFIANVAHFVDDLGEMSDEIYLANRESAIAALTKRSASFPEELAKNSALAFQFHGDFADNEKQIAALNALTRERWVELVREFITGDARRVSIQLDGLAARRRFQERTVEELRGAAEGWFSRPKPQDEGTEEPK